MIKLKIRPLSSCQSGGKNCSLNGKLWVAAQTPIVIWLIAMTAINQLMMSPSSLKEVACSFRLVRKKCL